MKFIAPFAGAAALLASTAQAREFLMNTTTAGYNSCQSVIDKVTLSSPPDGEVDIIKITEPGNYGSCIFRSNAKNIRLTSLSSVNKAAVMSEVRVLGATNIILTGFQINSAPRNCIQNNGTSTIVEDILMTNCTDAGIKEETGAQNALYRMSTIDTTGRAPNSNYIVGGKNINGDCIVMAGATGVYEYNIMTKCGAVANSFEHGMYVDDLARGYTIRYNKISNTGWDGIKAAGYGSIYGNRIFNVTRGMHLDLATSQITISGNSFGNLFAIDGTTVPTVIFQLSTANLTRYDLSANVYLPNQLYQSYAGGRTNFAGWKQATGKDADSTETGTPATVASYDPFTATSPLFLLPTD